MFGAVVPAEQKRRTRGRVDDAMRRIHRNREDRTFLPFEGELLRIAVDPDFRGAAAVDDEILLFVEMLFGIQRAGAGNFDDVAAPQTFGAEQLNERAVAAHALPRLARQILHAAHADVAIDRNALRFHEVVVGRVRPEKFSIAGPGLFICRFLKCLLSGMIHNASFCSIIRWNLQIGVRSRAQAQRICTNYYRLADWESNEPWKAGAGTLLEIKP